MAKPKYKHIVRKDMADESSMLIRDGLETLRQVLNLTTQESLYEGSNKDDLQEWTRKKNAQNLAFKNEVKQIVNQNIKTLKNEVKQSLDKLELTKKEVNKIVNQMQYSANTLGNVFIRQRNGWIADVKTNYKKNPDMFANVNILHRQIARTFKTNPTINKMRVPLVDSNGNQRYSKSGKPMFERWESKMEREVRTEIHKDIATDMVRVGSDLGIVFYICSSFGDSRKEHADLQGRIYYDESWESFDIDEGIKEKIRNYIEEHKLMTVQDAQNNYGLGTWCNCRHSFEYIDIESVLDIKTDEDMKQKLDDLKMSWNGEYEEKKNNALNEQRYNERNIKHWKEQMDEAELNYNTLPPTATEEEKMEAMKDVIYARNKVKAWQERQRALIRANDNLQRDYRRENPNDIYDLGVKNGHLPKPRPRPTAITPITPPATPTPQPTQETVVEEKVVKEFEYKPLNSVQECCDYLVSNGIAKKVSLGKISVENANKVTKQLAMLNNKYPLKEPLTEIVVDNRQSAYASANFRSLKINKSSYSINKEDYKTKKEEFTNTIDKCKTMLENKSNYTRQQIESIKRTMTTLEEAIKYNCEGIPSKVGSVEAIITHEYGHILADQYIGQINGRLANDNYNGNSSFNKEANLTRMTRDVYNKSKVNGDIYNMSYYASTNSHEFFAEAFAMKELGLELPENVNKMVEEVINYGKSMQ